MVVRSKLRPPITHTPGTTPCNQDKCKTCSFMCTSVEIQGPNCSMNDAKHFNCQTYNIVYVIRCTKCAKLYIGETGRTLDTRFKEHLADIKYHRDKPVASHFNQAGHSIHNVRVKSGQVRSEYLTCIFRESWFLCPRQEKRGEGVRGYRLHWRVQGSTSSPTGIGSRRRYCAGPLHVGGCIVTVQCTLWRAVCSCVRAVWLWSLSIFMLFLLPILVCQRPGPPKTHNLTS